ncbi:MAG: phage head spike fiber domain-containing protein, partial [Ktedonobacteraceae bacterium]
MSHYVNPAIGYTNSTGKTYFDQNGVLQTAAANVWPDEYDPATHAYLGKNIEQSSTNLLTYSQDFSNAAWGTSSHFSITAVDGPQGSGTAQLLTATSSGSWTIAQGFTAPSGTQEYTQTFIVKYGNHLVLQFLFYNFTTSTGLNGATLTFNSNGTVSSFTDTLGTGGYKVLPNGWVKCWFSQTTGISAGNTIGIYGSSTGQPFVTGDTLYLATAQVEQGTFPTPYIYTTSAAVTRAIDQATFLPGLINLSQGSFVASGMVPSFNYPVTEYPAILTTESIESLMFFEGGLGITSCKLKGWNGSTNTYITPNSV